VTDRVPVTLLTGFLGAGKTTLLNHLLTAKHGRRIAVVENEFGEVGIDHELVVNADEEVFEMSNGCICCTVRGDLIRVLGNLAKRRERFDYVLVETTGLADPGPVAQTFFVDDDVRASYVLDGIVTVVDAVHVATQVGRSRECDEQIAFADVILLNKVDRVAPRELDAVEARIRAMNGSARLLRTERGRADPTELLDRRAFDLTRALQTRPSFLEPEYPFEWTGAFVPDVAELALVLDDGPDPTMDVLVLPLAEATDDALPALAERAVRGWAEDPVVVQPGGSVPLERRARLVLPGEGQKRFALRVPAEAPFALCTQHLPDEFALHLTRAVGVDPSTARPVPPGLRMKPPSGAPVVVKGSEVEPRASRAWVGAHEHDDEVGSFALEADGDLSAPRFHAWMGALLRERGVDLFRMKGFLAFEGEARRVVFHAVHMLAEAEPDRSFAGPRRSQLVVIGRNLDRAAIEAGFRECLA
jgi:G3E family GTPase